VLQDIDAVVVGIAGVEERKAATAVDRDATWAM